MPEGASKTSPTRGPCIHVGAESFLIKNHQFRAGCALDCGVQSQAPEDTAIGISGSSGAPIKRIQGHRGENARMKNLRKTVLGAPSTTRRAIPPSRPN